MLLFELWALGVTILALRTLNEITFEYKITT